MSLWPRPAQEIPELTVRVARAAFPGGTLAIRLRDSLGPVFEDAQFSDLFAKRGHPSLSPGRLALVSVLQSAENLTDRQAAEAVRARLLAGDDAERLLEILLEHFKQAGLLGKGGRARTDSTRVLAAVRTLNRNKRARRQGLRKFPGSPNWPEGAAG